MVKFLLSLTGLLKSFILERSINDGKPTSTIKSSGSSVNGAHDITSLLFYQLHFQAMKALSELAPIYMVPGAIIQREHLP